MTSRNVRQAVEEPWAIIGSGGDHAPDDLLEQLRTLGDVVRARDGQMLVAAGARADDVYFILSGTLRITNFAADGREVIIRDLGAGGFVGDLAAIDRGRRSLSVVAVGDSRLLVVPGSSFRAAIFGAPAAAEWFALHLVNQVRRLTERVIELSTLNVRSRLHCHLLRLCAASGVEDNRATIEPLPTHEVMATMIGTHREAVTRELSYLASIGIVQQGRRRLEILDVDRLASLVRQVVGE
jgi:CRP-like cAMP-binding protein